MLGDLIRRLKAEQGETGTLCGDAAMALESLHQELRNIAEAKRFDRSVFADDTEFADWAQSRCRYHVRGDAAADTAVKAAPTVCDRDPRGCWNVRCQLGKRCVKRQWA